MLEALNEIDSNIQEFIKTHQKNRDEWNSKVVENRTKRDQVNGSKRELYDEIERQREVRDMENTRARESKVIRKQANEAFFSLKEKLTGSSDDRRDRRGSKDNPEAIRRQMAGLESKYERGGFVGRKAEKQFQAEMKRLSRKLKDMASTGKATVTGSADQEELDELHEKREAAHAEVVKAADAAQAAHDLMGKLRDETRRMNKEHEKAHQEFVKAKKEADREHQHYIVAMRCAYSAKNLIKAKENREAGIEPSRVEATAQSVDLMGALMSGQTLSTEQLMAMKRDD